MQFTHEARAVVSLPVRDVWAHWSDVQRFPRYLSHLRGTAASESEEDIVRLVIILDGRHIEFAAQRTMCDDYTICWQSLGPTFLYVLSISLASTSDGTEVNITVAYDPPGFLPDIAESLGFSRSFKQILETDLHRYANSFRHGEYGVLAMTE